mmetsp:Transcript_24266/g.44613  ORF Transcript_24266/g.44613 Transcript_24266/m.44613 type:complete len:256 (-) Transcript_24266:1249-2016(-)
MMSEQPNIHSEGDNTPSGNGYAANDITCPSSGAPSGTLSSTSRSSLSSANSTDSSRRWNPGTIMTSINTAFIMILAGAALIDTFQHTPTIPIDVIQDMVKESLFSWIAVVVHPFHFTDHLVVVVIATIAARSNCDGGGAIAGFAIPNPRPIIFGTLLTATPTATTTAAAALTLGTLGAATRTALRLGLGGLTMHLTPLAPHTRKQTPILILHLPLSIRTVILVNIARIPPFPSVLILILHVLDANLLFATGRGLA